MINKLIVRMRAFLPICFVAACGAPVEHTGLAARDVPLGQRGAVSGVGIGGADIVSMTNSMAQDILSSGRIAQREEAGLSPPRVIIDGKYFRIEGSQPLNRNLVTQRLLVELNRASKGRLIFVGRRHVKMVEKERELKRAGVVDSGTVKKRQSTLGADYRLAVTFSTLDSGVRQGAVQRYSQFVFELIELESGEVAWSNIYEVERSALDNVVYR